MANISKINFKGVEYNIKPLMDTVPTANSTNAVQSGGVYSALDALGEELNSTTENFNNFVETGESVVYKGTVGGTRAVVVDVNIPVGTYNLHIDNISSSDTDSDKSMIQFRYASNMLANVYERGVEINSTVTFVSQVVHIAFLAAQSLNESAGDSFTYSGVKLYTEPFAKKKDFDDAKGDLTAMQTATASDVGKALKAKTVTDNKVTEWEFGTIDMDTIIDVESMESMTDTEKLYRFDGEIYYYNGKSWLKVSTGSFVESVEKNMIDKTSLEEGSIDASDGIVKVRSAAERARWSSDFIPVQGGDICRNINANIVCAYDSNKQFTRQIAAGNHTSFVVGDNEEYIRVDFAKQNIDTVMLCFAKYYDSEDDTIYVSIDAAGRTLVTKTLTTYANGNPLYFYKTRNLFDYLNDEYYIKGQIDTTTGAYKYYIWDSDIPDSANASIAPTEYYPVSYGQTLFCNFYCWQSAYYDINKQYLGSIPARGAYEGWVVPEGCAFVRVSIKGSNTTPTPSDSIGNLSEMHKVVLYTVDTDQTIAPKPMEGLLPYQIDGRMIAPNYLDTVIPNMVQSEFLSAMRCMAIREVNRREHAYRIGNFNMWVMARKTGWYMARKMFMDYGLDFCGMEEVNTTSDISNFMKSWQFPYGFDTNFSDGEATIDKSLLSRFPVLSSRKLYTTSSGSSVALLNSKIQLPRLNDVYNPKRILSLYVVHLPITSDANKVSVANEILTFIANDTSDYVVIFGDTNDFGTSEETKLYWRTFEAGGFRTVIPITTKTITADNLNVIEGDHTQEWRKNSIDQFLVSSNIEAVSYGVVNTKDEYGLTSVSVENEPVLSDHDFVYVDLVFKDEARSGLAQNEGE